MPTTGSITSIFSESKTDSTATVAGSGTTISINSYIAAELDPFAVSERLIVESCKILKCDRVSMYFVDNGELVLLMARGVKGIRVPIGRGIAGSVASTGQTQNIDDAYLDPRFSSAFDLQTGYRTRSVLAVAVVDQNGAIVGVLQAINKISGDADAGSENLVFDREDVMLFENLAIHTGVSLRNAQIFEQSLKVKQQLSCLLEIIEMLQLGDSVLNINSLIFTLTQRAPTLVDADRATLYFIDKQHSQLVMMQGNIDLRFPLSKGIAGYVATSGAIVNIPEAYADSRFNQAIDKKSGYVTKSILALPIFNREKEAIGVLQVMNKKNEQPFDKQDQEMLQVLLRMAGPLLESAKLFQSKKQVSEVGATHNVTASSASTLSAARARSSSATIIEEADE